MKLHATIDDFQTGIDLQIDGSKVRAELDGRTYELELGQRHDRQLVMIFDGAVFYCRIDGEITSGAPLDVSVGTTQHRLVLIDPKRLRSAAVAGAHAGGAARILAPMPGKIVRVMVEPGAQVEAGAGVVVVEAMKMQNEMKSPKAGVVASVNVEVGGTVNGGDGLVVIE